MKIIETIKALLRKTIENGCTENEALAAAEKARELIDKHEVGESDLHEKQEEAVQTVWTCDGKRMHEVQFSSLSIGRYCEVRAYTAREKGSGNRTLNFIGIEHDTLLAYFLVDLFRNCMDSQWRAYQKSGQTPAGVHGKTIRKNFMVSMARRLNERLDVMTLARTAAQENYDGRQLVVSKNALIAKKINELGLRLQKTTNRSRGNAEAARAGQAAGDRVNITTGINKGRAGNAIGYAR